MTTTTIRVDIETHAHLLELSSSRGVSLMQTVREATEALRRQHFARQVADELAALRGDDSAWSEYLAEAQETEVRDGLRR